MTASTVAWCCVLVHILHRRDSTTLKAVRIEQMLSIDLLSAAWKLLKRKHADLEAFDSVLERVDAVLESAPSALRRSEKGVALATAGLRMPPSWLDRSPALLVRLAMQSSSQTWRQRTDNDCRSGTMPSST